MKHEKEFFYKSIAVIAVIAVFALLYGAISIQNAGAKLEAQELIVKSIGSESNAQPAGQPTAPKEAAKISLISITDSSKNNLISLASLPEQLKKLEGLSIVSEKSLDLNSAEARQLIEKYKIERIPAFLIQGEAGKSQVLTQVWGQLGSIESDGTLVLRNSPPVYLEIASGKTRGLVNAVYLAVPDRNEVFSALIFRQILNSAFGMKPALERTIDYNSAEGKALIEKYKLEKLPALFLSGDVNAYSGFGQTWLQAGSSEQDGNFIFRNLELLQGLKYLDLNLGKVVEAASLPAQPQGG